MNDTVESIYEQMFAPNEIPQEVVELYDRTKFFADRIDQPQMHSSMLALIGAVATMGKVKINKPKPQTEMLIDTSEDEKDTETGSSEEIDEKDTETASEPTLEPGYNSTPTGPMDAPAQPENLNPGRTESYLQRLTATELRAHAKEFYKWTPPINLSKAKLVKGILNIKPQRAGFNEDIKQKVEK